MNNGTSGLTVMLLLMTQIIARNLYLPSQRTPHLASYQLPYQLSPL